MIGSLETAEIIAVGSELLTPHRIDTNSLFLTGRLNDVGIVVRGKSVVGDNREDLAERVRDAIGRVDVVITTGGLGPTDDDLTRDVVAEVLERPFHVDGNILAGIEARFARRGVRMPDINRRQANVPEGATVLANPNGTAPGLLLDASGRIIVLLPGPPREMQPMFDAFVGPLLAERTAGSRVYRRVLKVTGRSESQVEEVANPIYTRLGTDQVRVETTILATPGQIELHLASAGHDSEAINHVLDDGLAELAAALGDPVFSTDGRTLEAVVGDALRDRGWRIATAESCTGGMLAGRLTDVPGSSAYVVGGIVAYSNSVKMHDLGVASSTLEDHGAVSEEVARTMAAHVRQHFAADVGVAVTGIAGPGGGTPSKPVGTVWVSVATAAGVVARQFHFPGDRDAIRRHTTAAALEMVRREMR